MTAPVLPIRVGDSVTTTVVPADLLDRVRGTLAVTGAEPTPVHVAAALRADGTICGDAMVLAVVTALRREALGAGPLDSLLAEPGVTDILVNGPDEVYIDRGHGLEFVAIRTGDEPAIRRLATRLAAAAGRRLDDSTPYVDVHSGQSVLTCGNVYVAISHRHAAIFVPAQVQTAPDARVKRPVSRTEPAAGVTA